MPFFGFTDRRTLIVEGVPAPARGREPVVLVNRISDKYLDTVGTKLLRGRGFTAADAADSPPVFLVNRSLAEGLFGDSDPVGRRISLVNGDRVQSGEIGGVVEDVRSVFAEPPKSMYQLYRPLRQEPSRYLEVAVRVTGGDSTAFVGDIRRTLAGLDPDLPVRELFPAEVLIGRLTGDWKVLQTILSTLALLGLALAALGIYGVVNRTVVQRMNEFGVRLALGAQSWDIGRRVLGSGLKLALLGSILGVAGGVAIGRLIAAAFPEMETASDPVVGWVLALLVAAALLACYLPARKAARISPAAALRAE